MKGFAPTVEWILRSVREWFMGAAGAFPWPGLAVPSARLGTARG